VGWSVVEPYSDAGVRGSRLFVTAASAFAAALVLWRRRRPLTVLTLGALAMLLPALAWGASELSSQAITVAVGTYSCGRFGRRPGAYAAPAIGAGTILAQLALDPLNDLGTSWAWSLNAPGLFLFGAWVRQQASLAESAATTTAALAAAESAEERLRLSREVHDVLAHNLAIMLVQAGAADELLDTDPARARAALEQVHRTGRGAMGDVRRLLGALRGEPATNGTKSTDPDADIPGLVTAVRQSGVPVTLTMTGDLAAVAPETASAAYRVVQESLTNVLRHAGGTSTQVSVDVSGEEVRIRVENAPPGGPGAAGPQAGTGGHGLEGMRARVTARGGTFSAAPTPEGGYGVSAFIPSRAAPGRR
jgi:signal transduction histidine kinase